MLKRVVAGLLRLSILSVVFMGSCAGSAVLYMQSPKWDLAEVNLEKDKTFFGAYTTEENDKVEIVLYRFLPDPSESKKIKYRLQREEISQVWEGGGSASVTVIDEVDGSQLIRIHVIGDTPWASISEYRVTDNEIHPLRHGAANLFFLIGALFSPFITWFARKPVRRIVEMLFKMEKKKSERG